MLNLADSISRFGVVIALSATVATAEAVDLTEPAPRLVIEYAETAGLLLACGRLGTEDRTEELAAAVAEYAKPGFWQWLLGEQNAYRAELFAAATAVRSTVQSQPCRVGGLAGSYRTLMRTTASTLLDIIQR